MNNVGRRIFEIGADGGVGSTFAEFTKLHDDKQAGLLEDKRPPEVFDNSLAESMIWAIVSEILTEDADFVDYFDDHILRESVTAGDYKLLETAREKIRRIAISRSGAFIPGVLDGMDVLVKDEE